ncbi:MAG: glycoside hydrolase family 88 protein [Lachnospiraceae bacterium]|nr:glycoside hydrolase family 88 protein [Lachnospiraceae bacterium]
MSIDKRICESVIKCMLSMQRYPWEQGACAQALYEAGYDELWIPMAYDSVKRMSDDGRLAMIGGEVAVSDPAANGEVCLRAYQMTGDESFKSGADRMLDFLLNKAPRTGDGIICHNNVSFKEGFSPYQLWIDGIYMVPPFLAVMGYLDEAVTQIRGYITHLYDKDAGLFYHIVDVENQRFVRKVHWATGNGWALMGLARVIEEADRQNRSDIRNELTGFVKGLLDSLFKYQLPDGRFRDILDDPESFTDGASAMMMTASVYRMVLGGFLDLWAKKENYENIDSVKSDYLDRAGKAYETVQTKVDSYGLIREVSGCPHFISEGTSAEAQAAFIMAAAWRSRCEDYVSLKKRIES